MKFLYVRTDYAFKKVFGSENSKAILLSFLNSVLSFGKERITDLTIVDPYQVPLLKGMKDTYDATIAEITDLSEEVVRTLRAEGN